MTKLTRSCVAVLFVCVAVCAVGGAQTACPKKAGPEGAARQQLQLTLTPVEQKYCAGDGELDVLDMRLRLRYTNKGRHPVILYKGAGNVLRIMVSRNVEEARNKLFEVNASSTEISAGETGIDYAPTPSPAFVVLAPEDTYETETGASVFVRRTAALRIEGSVPPGDHVLQLQIATWPETGSLAEKLRVRWRESGYLWSDPVTSEPMAFKIMEQRTVVECQ